MGSTDDVGQRVRTLRLSRGLSQEQVAGPGVSPSYVSLIESGRRHPTDAALATLAAALGTSADYLRHGEAAAQRRQTELDLRTADLRLASGDAEGAEQAFRVLVDDHVPPDLRASARLGLARSLEALGRLEEAIAAYETLREAAGAADHASWVDVTIALVRCYREAGDLGRSADLGERALDTLAALGLPGTDLHVQLVASVAFTAYERGDLVRARQLVDRAVDQANGLGSSRAQGAALWNAAVITAERGELATALELSQRALLLFNDAAGTRNSARLRNSYAELLLRTDPPATAKALDLLRSAHADLTESGTVTDLAYCETEMARAHLMLGDASTSIRLAREALHHLPAAEDRLERSRALVVLADAWRTTGDVDAADAAYREAAAALETVGAGRQAAKVWRQLAAERERAGDLPGAVAALKAATAAVGVDAELAGAADRTNVLS